MKLAPDVVDWLVETMRNDGVVRRMPPPDAERALPRRAAWSRDLGHAVFELPYEPRAMAVARRVQRVAVGCKDGTVVVVARCESLWFEECRVTVVDPSDGRPIAVRGLAFLDERTLVVGVGAGDWSVVTLPGEVEPGRFSEPEVEVVRRDAHSAQEDWHASLSRFEGVARLIEPGAWEASEGPVAAGWTRRGALHLLSRQGGRWVAHTRRSDEVYPELLTASGTTPVVVGIAGARGRAWVLSATGVLLAVGSGEQPSTRYRIEPAVEGARFRALSTCSSGLAVLSHAHAAFLPFADGEQNLCIRALHDHGLEPEAFWTTASAAVSVSVSWPLSRRLDRLERSKRQPQVHVVIGRRDQDGVRIRSWCRSGPNTPGGVASWSPSRMPRAVKLRGDRPVTHVLHVRFASVSRAGPAWLVSASREGQLVISSLVPVTGLLRALRDGQVDPRTWDVKRALREDLSPRACLAGAGATEDGAAALVADLGDAGLRRLVAWITEALLDCWRKLRRVRSLRRLCSHADSAGDFERFDRAGQEAVARYRLWILWVMRRAHALSTLSPEKVARLLERDLLLVDPDRDPPGPRSGSDLLVFADFLKKWFVNARSYDGHQERILELIRHNRGCGHSLDALAYEVRLMGARVDTQWRLPPRGDGRPVRALACSPDQQVLLSTTTDGRIRACDRAGLALTWRVATGVRGGSDLCVDGESVHGGQQEGRSLHRADLASYLSTYHRGPYSRSLCTVALAGRPDSFLLLFVTRGWRSDEGTPVEKTVPGWLAVLVVQYLAEDGELQILEAQEHPLQGELYTLVPPSRALSKRTPVEVLGGTGGTWLTSGVGRRAPLAAITLAWKRPHDDREPTIEVAVTPIWERASQSDDQSVFAGLPSLSYRPCWALVRLRVGAREWLVGGLHDGTVRTWSVRDGEEGRWVEEAEQQRLAFRGSIFSLLAWKQRRRGRRDVDCLAVGTTDGVVAAFRGASRGETPCWSPLLASREGVAPVVGLFHLHQHAVGSDEKVHHLLAVTQEGGAALYDVDVVLSCHPPAAVSDRLSGLRACRFPSLRLDRFRLPVAPGVICVLDGDEEPPLLVSGGRNGHLTGASLRVPVGTKRRQDLLSVMVGRDVDIVPDGPVEPSDAGFAPSFGDCIGRARWDLRYDWLRQIPFSDDSLVEYAIWRHLRQEGRRLVVAFEEAIEDPTAERVAAVDRFVDGFEELLGQLARELVARSPEHHGPARRLWEVCARIANQLAERSLDTGLDADLRAWLLDRFLRLQLRVHNLVLWWIGAGFAIERKVQMHTFKQAFDWSGAMLLAWRPRSSGDELRRVRQRLLQSVVRPRLYFADPLVPMEALDSINRAMWQAAVFTWVDERGQALRPDLTLGFSSSDDPSDHGFYDLLVMVGDIGRLWRTNLDPGEPLVLALARFFSLTLVLFPEAPMLVAQVVSESRLLEGPALLAPLIATEARRLIAQLEAAGAGRLHSVRRGLDDFAAYCEMGHDIKALQALVEVPGGANPWDVLLGRTASASRGVSAIPSGDRGFMAELHVLLTTVGTISRLHNEGGPPETLVPDRVLRDTGHRALQAWASDWLSPDVTLARRGRARTRHFRHSHAYLVGVDLEGEGTLNAEGKPRYRAGLLALRRTLRTLIRARYAEADLGVDACGRPVTIGSDAEVRDPHLLARRLCEEELARLEEANSVSLFEPERSLFRALLRTWLAQIEERSVHALRLVEWLDAFNRHVYRQAASELMSALVQLALQSGPLWPVEGADVPLRRRMRDRLAGRPLEREVVECGIDLVESTHLAGTLMAVAQRVLHGGSPAQSVERTRLSEIRTLLMRATRAEGLELVATGLEDGDLEVPGPEAVWDTILGELVRNARRHGGERAAKLSVRVDASGSMRLWGDQPFTASLDPAEMGVQEEWSFEVLRGCAARALEPRTQLGLFDGRTGGMGLTMVRDICDYLGLRVEILLVNDQGVNVADAPEGAPKAARFCVSIPTLVPMEKR